MPVPGAADHLIDTVTAWEGVTRHPHRFGGTEFRLGKRELGHIHGNHLVDIPFPVAVRKEIVAAGQAQPHHILPESGWISLYLRQPADLEQAIQLFERSYQLARKQQAARTPAQLQDTE